MELTPKEKAKQIYNECELIGLQVYGGMALGKEDVLESALTWVNDKLIELGTLKDTKENIELYDYFVDVELDISKL